MIIASADGAAIEKAIEDPGHHRRSRTRGSTRAVVRKVVDFGAFVEIMPGTDGLLHISELPTKRIHRVEDVLHEGDEIKVKVIEIDRSGKIRLSVREAQEELAEGRLPSPRESSVSKDWARSRPERTPTSPSSIPRRNGRMTHRSRNPSRATHPTTAGALPAA